MEYAERAEFTEVQDRGDREIVFHIVEHVGVLSETKGWKKELNLVSWNKKPAKFDIRDWDDYHEHMRKGVTLTRGELRELKNILEDVDFSKAEVPDMRSRRQREDALPPLMEQGEGMTEPPAAAGEGKAAAGPGSDEAVPF